MFKRVSPFAVFLMSVALPIGGGIFIHSGIVERDGNRLWNVFLGIGLLIGSYFFTINITVSYISYLYGWISRFFNIL